MTTTDLPRLGDGIYTLPEAAEILSHRTRPLTKRKLSYWIKSGLTPASHLDVDGLPILTFHDLISLELVGRLLDKEVSLHKIREIEAALRLEFPDLGRPFAYKIFYTDGDGLWAKRKAPDGEDHVVELIGRHAGRGLNHLVFGKAIETFAEEIEFGHDREALAWTVSPWVEIDPTVQFGKPLVAGTRVPVRTVVANLEAGTPAEVADWYGLTVEQVEGARDYVEVH